MKKKYQYFILLIIVIFLIIGIKEIIMNAKSDTNNKVVNNGSTLSERFANLYEIVNSGSGLYKIDGKYVFKGNSDNYIAFNEELWRIVSLEKDGTVKIVRNDLLNLKKNYKDAIEYLNNDYYNSLKNKNLIEKKDFNTTYYDIGNLTTEEDLNNASIVSAEKYHVGMLSVIEIANATTYVTFDQYLNLFFWVNRNSNYLYLSEKWLTMTPSVYVNYDFLKENANESAMIRPSVYLKKDLKIKSGSGTKNNPYILNKNY